MSREVHVRFCENVEGRLLCVTRLVILAALATIAIPIFINKSGTSKQIAHNENVSTLQSQGNAYLLSLHTMPFPDEELLDDLESNGYIKEIPTNPLTGNKDYSVKYNATKGSVEVTPIREEVTGVVSGGSGGGGGSSEYDSVMGCNKPKLTFGMTELNFNGTDFVNATEQEKTDKTWYNYQGDIEDFAANKANEKWANVKLNDGSMFVWIPRYTYKITGDDTTVNATDDKIQIKYSNGTTDDTADGYIAHPAFNFGGTQLTGIWVAKFEASNDGSANVQVKSGVASWKGISVNDIFNECRAMQSGGNSYGISTDTNVIDTHMMKNSEWGAVAYITEAIRDGDEISINNNSNYITGHGATAAEISGHLATTTARAYSTADSMEASTTGNVYGIYDISGGSWEYVASYIGVGNANGASLLAADAKYKDVLAGAVSMDPQINYVATEGQTNGWSLHEVETSGTGSSTFRGYSDYQGFPATNLPFFLRSCYHSHNVVAGIFASGGYSGGTDGDSSFRPVLVAFQ